MKAKRILSLILTMLMVLSICPVFVANAEYLASGPIYAADGETVRAMIHDWKTDADDEGFTAVGSYYFSDTTNPRPKFATWGSGTPSMNEDGEFVLTASNATLMMEIDHLSAVTPNLRTSQNLDYMVIRFKATETAETEQSIALVYNRGNSVELKEENPYDQEVKGIRARKYGKFTATGEYQTVAIDLTGSWEEKDDNGNDFTDLVKTPYVYPGFNQYRLDFPNGTYAIDYIGFFESEEDFAIYDAATRTFDDPEKADAPTGLEGVAPETEDGEGKITGVDATMEYATSADAEEWTAIEGEELAVVPGTYYVRVAATEGVLASEAVEVVVPVWVDPDLEPGVLHNIFKKLASGDDVKIGYFGGSVTDGANSTDKEKYSWRARVGKWFTDTYPDTAIENRHAAIGGTGSHFGSFRTNSAENHGLQLDQKPADLVFIEFSVNDRYENRTAAQVKADTEVIYNKIWDANPNAEIVVILITDKGAAGADHTQLVAHRELAEQFDLVTINVGKYLYEQIAAGVITEAEAFSDVVHLTDDGFAVYAEKIIADLTALKTAAEPALAADYVDYSDKMTDVAIDRELYMVGDIPGYNDYATAEGFTASNGLSAVYENSAVSFEFTGTNAYLWTSKKADNGIYEVYVNGEKSDYVVDMWRSSEGGQQHAIPVFAEDKAEADTYEITLVLKTRPDTDGISNYFKGIAVYGIGDNASPIKFVETDREALGIDEIEYIYEPIVVPGSYFKKTFTLWKDDVGTNSGALTFVTGNVGGENGVQGFVPVTTDRPEGSLSTPDKDDSMKGDGYGFDAYGLTPANYKYAVIDYYYLVPEGTEPGGTLPYLRVAAPKVIEDIETTGTLEANKWAKAEIDFSENETWNDTSKYGKATVITHTNFYPFGKDTKGADMTDGEVFYLKQITFYTKKPNTELPEGLESTPSAGSDGTITGVDETMEYSVDGGETWIPVSGTTITGLATGTVLVRFAETDTLSASEAVEVVVSSTADAEIVEYIEARYPDATAIFYVSSKGSDSNDGLTPSSPLRNVTVSNKVNSKITANGTKGDFVIVVMDDWTVQTLMLKEITGTVTFTCAPGHRAVFNGVRIENAPNAHIIFDEFPILLGNPGGLISDASRSWYNYNAEIQITCYTNQVTFNERAFAIDEYAVYTTKNILDEENSTADKKVYKVVDADPSEYKTRTSLPYITYAYDGGTHTATGKAITVKGGTYHSMRASGYNTTTINGDMAYVIEGGTFGDAIGVAGHGNTCVSTGNVYFTMTGGEGKVVLGGKDAGKHNGNIYAEISGGKIPELKYGARAASAIVDGDIIVTVSGDAEIAALAVNANVTGNKVLLLDEGYTLDAAVPASVNYVIQAPALGGKVTIELDENGAFAGIKAVPTNAEHVVYVNGVLTETDDGVILAEALPANAVIEMCEEKKEPTLAEGDDVLVTEQATEEDDIKAIVGAYDASASADNVAYAATASLKDASGADVAIDENAQYDIIVPKSILGEYEAYADFYGRLAYDAENVYLTVSGADLAKGIVIFGVPAEDDDAQAIGYYFEVSYDADNSEAVVDAYIKSDAKDINGAGIGFEVDGYTISEPVFDDAVEYAYSETVTVEDSSAVFAWVAKAETDAVKTTEGRVKLFTTTIDMTADEYKTLRSDFITEADGATLGKYFYDVDASKYLATPDEAHTGIVTAPIEGITVVINYTVDVTAEGIDDTITSDYDIASTATMYEDFTFTAKHEEGAYVEVTYKVGENATPVVVDAVNGVYTIPGDDIIDDITIVFTYGTPIENIALTGLEAPVALETPDTDVEAEANANYTVSEVTWEPDVEAFDYNTTYKASVIITANDEYSVSTNTEVTIDGELATVEYLGAGKIKATVEMTSADRVAVDEVAVSDIDVPVAGEAQDTEGSVADDADYTIESITWEPVVGEYDYATEYKVTVKVNTNEGFKVTDATTFTINGETATVTDYTTTSITAEFTYTSADRVAVDEVAVTDIDVPAAGEAQDTEGSVADDANYTIESITWEPVVDEYDYATEYKVTVKVNTNEGYKVTDATTFTINGETATVTDYTTTSITAEFTYTSADRVAIDEIAVTDIDVPVAGEAQDTEGSVADDADYTIESITWEPVVGEYDYATEYKVTVKVNANEGFKVTDATTFTINGETATVTDYTTTSITAEFTYTSADRITAGNLEIIVETPSATATPKDAEVKIPDGETDTPYSVVSTVWTDGEGNAVDGVFDFDTEYKATITVDLADTHKLPDDFTITVGEKTFTATDYTVNADGTVTFTVTFDATGSNMSTIGGKIGLVRTAEDAPKSYATITFKDAAGNALRTETIETADSMVDADGYITVADITLDFVPGTYSAVISKNGYLDFTVTDIVIGQMVSATEYTQLTFTADLKPGDIIDNTATKNGVIDFEDYIRVTRAFADSSEFSEEAYNELVGAVDIDEDGMVTIFDLIYVSNNFGKKAADCSAAAVAK